MTPKDIENYQTDLADFKKISNIFFNPYEKFFKETPNDQIAFLSAHGTWDILCNLIEYCYQKKEDSHAKRLIDLVNSDGNLLDKIFSTKKRYWRSFIDRTARDYDFPPHEIRTVIRFYPNIKNTASYQRKSTWESNIKKSTEEYAKTSSTLATLEDLVANRDFFAEITLQLPSTLFATNQHGKFFGQLQETYPWATLAMLTPALDTGEYPKIVQAISQHSEVKSIFCSAYEHICGRLATHSHVNTSPTLNLFLNQITESTTSIEEFIIPEVSPWLLYALIERSPVDKLVITKHDNVPLLIDKLTTIVSYNLSGNAVSFANIILLLLSGSTSVVCQQDIALQAKCFDIVALLFNQFNIAEILIQIEKSLTNSLPSFNK